MSRVLHKVHDGIKHPLKYLFLIFLKQKFHVGMNKLKLSELKLSEVGFYTFILIHKIIDFQTYITKVYTGFKGTVSSQATGHGIGVLVLDY